MMRTTGGGGEQRSGTAAAGAAPHGGNDHAHLFVFTNGKAGMDNVDQSKVNQVVYESSKESAFFANAEKRDAKTEERVARMRRDLAVLRREDLAPLRGALNKKAAALERERDLSRVWMVIDMDCFFAAVAALDNPELRGRPLTPHEKANAPALNACTTVYASTSEAYELQPHTGTAFAVGGIGMLSTSSYEARKFGVRSAMPGFIAKKLCPHLTIVPSDFPRYKEMARRTREPAWSRRSTSSRIALDCV